MKSLSGNPILPLRATFLRRIHAVIQMVQHKWSHLVGLLPAQWVKAWLWSPRRWELGQFSQQPPHLHVTDVTSCPHRSYLSWHLQCYSCVIPVLLQGFHCSCVYICHKSAYLFPLELLAEERRQAGKGKCICHEPLYLYVHWLVKDRDHPGVTRRSPVVVPCQALGNGPLPSCWVAAPQGQHTMTTLPRSVFMSAHRWMSVSRHSYSPRTQKGFFPPSLATGPLLSLGNLPNVTCAVSSSPVSPQRALCRHTMGHEKQNPEENEADPLLSTIFLRSAFRTHIMQFFSPAILCHQTHEGKAATRTYTIQWFNPIGYSSVSSDCIKGRHWETLTNIIKMLIRISAMWALR